MLLTGGTARRACGTYGKHFSRFEFCLPPKQNPRPPMKSARHKTAPQEKERLERQIEFTDKAIDSLVYELYGLNEEEIKIVEGGQ